MFRRQYLVIAGLIFLTAIFYLPFFQPMTDDIRQAIGASVRPFYRLGVKLVEYKTIIMTIGDIIQENSQLKDDNIKLQTKLNALTEVAHENDLLRQQLAIDTPPDHRLIAAPVVGFDPVNLNQSILINQGTNQGIKTGAPVLLNGYLIGIVSRADSKSATVQLLTSHRTRLSVKLQQSRAPGLLKGGLRGVIVEDIPIDQPVSVGETVVTAGQLPILRPGLPIGEVSQILSGHSDIFQTALIKTPLASRSLDVVFIEL